MFQFQGYVQFVPTLYLILGHVISFFEHIVLDRLNQLMLKQHLQLQTTIHLNK